LRGHCLRERLFGILMAVVIVLELVALLLSTQTMMFRIEVVSQTVACSASAAIIATVLVRN
jgi:hypothetical protein